MRLSFPILLIVLLAAAAAAPIAAEHARWQQFRGPGRDQPGDACRGSESLYIRTMTRLYRIDRART